MSKNKRFIEKARTVHGDIYDYTNAHFVSTDQKVEIICPIHGSFHQTPRNHIYKKNGCNACAIERSKKTTTKTTRDFIEQAKKIHNDKYEYSNTLYVNARTPVKIICPIHGVFEQLPSSHTRGRGCKKCAVRGDHEWFISRATEVHGDRFNYEVQYTTGKDKIDITCKAHGVFAQRAESHLAGTGCPTCSAETRSFSSKAEQELCDILSAHNLDFVTGDRTLIHPKEIDIYVPSKKIAIEYNGVFWHSELGGKDKYYHLQKTKQCESKGVQLIHVYESEWLSKPTIVQSRLLNKLGVTTENVYARKCNIEELTSKEAKEFLTKNHIQGSCRSSVKLGLIANGDIVAVMTFGKSRFNKLVQWELLRYCTTLNMTVVGGASKLFKHFVKTHSPANVISYSDKRWNTGTVYTQLGFTFSHSSSPNYFYFRGNTTLMSRQKFQKHKLKDKLESFDPSLTEWENMKANGYNRIWDCGNDVWVWTPQFNY